MRLDERVDDLENKLDFDEFNENERKIWLIYREMIGLQ